MKYKIKADVDLKELENYGWKYDIIRKKYVSPRGYVGVFKNKILTGTTGTMAHSKMSAVEDLFDIIQAGLVEKVEEDK